MDGAALQLRIFLFSIALVLYGIADCDSITPPLSLTLDYMPKNAAPLQCLVPYFMRVCKRLKSGLSDLYKYLYDRGGKGVTWQLNPIRVKKGRNDKSHYLSSLLCFMEIILQRKSTPLLSWTIQTIFTYLANEGCWMSWRINSRLSPRLLIQENVNHQWHFPACPSRLQVTAPKEYKLLSLVISYQQLEERGFITAPSIKRDCSKFVKCSINTASRVL